MRGVAAEGMPNADAECRGKNPLLPLLPPPSLVLAGYPGIFQCDLECTLYRELDCTVQAPWHLP